VVPAGARQTEQSLTLDERFLRVRIGVDEDVAVIERGDQSDLSRAQHAVAEHVTTHVADADDGEWLRLCVATHLAVVAADSRPRAARRDAGVLVVVPVRAAGRERVAEPEAGFGSDLIRDIREFRGALV